MAAVKVGIIGVGGIAGTHVPGWLASEHAELIGGSDISELRRVLFAGINILLTLYLHAAQRHARRVRRRTASGS